MMRESWGKVGGPGPIFLLRILRTNNKEDVMAIFKGAGVAIVTPMFENGEVNYDKLGELLEYQIANSTDAIIICGTTGEASTLTHEEHLDVIKYAIDKVAKRVPVIAGTGSNSTETAVYLSVEAEKRGADALLQVTPYYNKATQKGLIRHFTAVAEAVNIPIILYNVPGRTGCNIQPETAVYLAKNVKNIVAIKEASGNIAQVAKLMSLGKPASAGCIRLCIADAKWIYYNVPVGSTVIISDNEPMPLGKPTVVKMPKNSVGADPTDDFKNPAGYDVSLR